MATDWKADLNRSILIGVAFLKNVHKCDRIGTTWDQITKDLNEGHFKAKPTTQQNYKKHFFDILKDIRKEFAIDAPGANLSGLNEMEDTPAWKINALIICREMDAREAEKQIKTAQQAKKQSDMNAIESNVLSFDSPNSALEVRKRSASTPLTDDSSTKSNKKTAIKESNEVDPLVFYLQGKQEEKIARENVAKEKEYELRERELAIKQREADNHAEELLLRKRMFEFEMEKFNKGSK